MAEALRGITYVAAYNYLSQESFECCNVVVESFGMILITRDREID